MNPKKFISKLVGGIVNSVAQTSSVKQENNFPVSPEITKICRASAAEGMVLLKNDGVLPLRLDETVSLFGRVQSDCFYVGYGSGGDVNEPYKISFSQALKDSGVKINKSLEAQYNSWREKNPVDNGYWGHWPMSYEEMPVDKTIAEKAAAGSECALVFIGRAAGEDRENTLEKGSYYLTEKEENMLRAVSESFGKWAVILNIGGIFDFSWVNKYAPPAILISWLGGMELGNACADVLTGKITPSGSLTDSVPQSYEDCPSAKNFGNKTDNTYEEDIYTGYRYFETFDRNKILFPFGFGLSYTEFKITKTEFSSSEEKVTVSAVIKNTGAAAGKKAVQLYSSSPAAALSQPLLQLRAFAKTGLLSPGEEQKVNFILPFYDFASYDDSGASGHKSAYVLEKGSHTFYVGFDVRDIKKAGELYKKETAIIRQLEEVSAVQPEKAFMRLTAKTGHGQTEKGSENAPVRTVNLRDAILKRLPKEMKNNKKTACTLADVETGSASIEDLVAALGDTELEAISRGDYVMNSPLGPKGNAGVLGGVLKSLRDKGIPPVVCTDGPSGIRLAANSALLACGTALACSWNTDLTENLYALLGREMRERGSDILLAPGMNIHRNPLCGRNFEYFSEDPVVSGHMAAAVVKGLQSAGVGACPKHFACNNQETNRTHTNSVVSERALREIYLKGFEICVKEAAPLCIMTSYNKVNGVWSHYNYDFATTLLRGEWGYNGLVMTDWWMRSASSPEFPNLKDQAYRVRAQVDVLMPGGARVGRKKPDGTLLASLGKPNGITKAELQRTAANVIGMILKLRALRTTGD